MTYEDYIWMNMILNQWDRELESQEQPEVDDWDKLRFDF